jgi:hypothetical protein
MCAGIGHGRSKGVSRPNPNGPFLRCRSGETPVAAQAIEDRPAWSRPGGRLRGFGRRRHSCASDRHAADGHAPHGHTSDRHADDAAGSGAAAASTSAGSGSTRTASGDAARPAGPSLTPGRRPGWSNPAWRSRRSNGIGHGCCGSSGGSGSSSRFRLRQPDSSSGEQRLSPAHVAGLDREAWPEAAAPHDARLRPAQPEPRPVRRRPGLAGLPSLRPLPRRRPPRSEPSASRPARRKAHAAARHVQADRARGSGRANGRRHAARRRPHSEP